VAALAPSAAQGRRRGVPPSLALRQTNGQATRFEAVAGARATVLVFVGTGCPISNKYAPQIKTLAQTYRAKGVRFVLVYPNAHTTGAEANKHARAFGLSGLISVLDADQSFATRVGATRTPEAVIVAADNTVQYVGRIDDRFVDRGLEQGGNGRVGEHSLRNALDALLAGRPYPPAAAKPSAA
jgi:thiol-disulfide isomerase/thioredoxin